MCTEYLGRSVLQLVQTLFASWQSMCGLLSVTAAQWLPPGDEAGPAEARQGEGGVGRGEGLVGAVQAGQRGVEQETWRVDPSRFGS